MRILILYSLFAVIATVTNIGGQEITIQLYSGPYPIVLSILIGTAIGLVTKYFFDKKYIFNHITATVADDSKMFVLYTSTGIITTAIFWGLEFGFDYYFQSKVFRYLGGIIGLSIGYIVKYQLDKRFVFVKNNKRNLL